MSFGLTIAEKNQIEFEAKRKVWLRNGWPWPPRKRTEYELAKTGARGSATPDRARKSSRPKCHTCGRWLNAQNRCSKLWSDGEGGWEHD